MKFIKKYFIYLILILSGISTPLFFHYLINQNFDTNKTKLLELSQKQMTNTVNCLFTEIKELRKTNDDSTVKKIIYSQITNQPQFINQKIYIKEIINYQGGNNYAKQFTSSSLKNSTPTFLSTNMQDIKGNFLYLQELNAIKEQEELYSQHFFENSNTQTTDINYEYSKLYKDYNWIVSCRVSQSALFATNEELFIGEKRILIFSDISITLIIFFGCFAIHYIKTANAKSNLIKISNAKLEAKTEFLSVLSHELRTPLNAIIGLNELLKENTENPKMVTDYSNKIHDSSQILLNLINDVLDMSAIEKGKLKFEAKRFNIIELVNSITNMYQNLAEKKGLLFICTITNVKNNILIGDSYRIRQILLNLLSNSLKFTETGTVELHIEEHPISALKSMFFITVIDSGCGMPDTFLKSLYTEFSQADRSIARKYGGSGLGLSITKKIVELMNGTISVESEVTVGSKFTVRVPLEINSTQKEILPTLDLNTFIINEKLLKETSILSVEDNNINQLIIVQLLKKYKMNVITASNGQEAIDKMKQPNNIKLILMDIRMPIMDGLTATRAIRKFNTKVPIIALSANAFIEDTKKSYEAGMNYHLSKPIDKNKLLSTIQTYL